SDWPCAPEHRGPAAHRHRRASCGTCCRNRYQGPLGRFLASHPRRVNFVYLGSSEERTSHSTFALFNALFGTVSGGRECWLEDGRAPRGFSPIAGTWTVKDMLGFARVDPVQPGVWLLL